MILHIDPEFKNLIPPLAEEEYSHLTNSLLAEGCREAIITWNGVIVDGHNRHEICIDNDIAFQTKELQFDDRDAVKAWIIRNQLARRNLEPGAKIKLAKLLEYSTAEQARMNQGRRTDLLLNSAKSYDPVDTTDETAKLAGVGRDTVRKYNTVEREAPDLLPLTQVPKDKGGMSINAAYNAIRKEKSPKVELTPEERAEIEAEEAAALAEIEETKRQHERATKIKEAIYIANSLDVSDQALDALELYLLHPGDKEELDYQLDKGIYNFTYIQNWLNDKKRPRLLKGGLRE